MWWTEADDAELSVLCWELVKAVRAHEARCPECSTVGVARANCAAMRDAFETVIEWRDGRVLASKAVWLRARQDEREALQGREEVRHAAVV